MKKSLCIMFLAFVALVSCSKKEETPIPVNTAVVFDSLFAERINLKFGEKTTIEAKATGEGVVYIWKTQLGEILGEGSKVIFRACCSGEIEVNCTVKDKAQNSLSKRIVIYVE